MIEKTKCKICSKVIDKYQSSIIKGKRYYNKKKPEKKFCSLKCAAQNKKKVKVKITCTQCSVVFNRTHKGQKFCSNKCSGLYHKSCKKVKSWTFKDKTKKPKRVKKNICGICNTNLCYKTHCESCSKTIRAKKEKIRSKKRYQTKKKEAHDLKFYFVFMSGGECISCRHQGNMRSLCFHHLQNKEFTLDVSSIFKHLHCKYKIFQEFNKCELLCHNCHAKKHYKGVRSHHKQKLKLTTTKNNECKTCNLKFNLQNITTASFHHHTPDNKEFDVGIWALGKYGYKKCLEESKKCDLLCLNCHQELHD